VLGGRAQGERNREVAAGAHAIGREQAINLDKRVVCKVHPSGWRQYQLRRHLRPLCSISRLVRKVIRCTPKRSSPAGKSLCVCGKAETVFRGVKTQEGW
jgi:hypothetical protein